MTRILGLVLSIFLLGMIYGPAWAGDATGKTPVRTVAIGDVTVELAGADGSSVVQIASSNGAAAANGLFVLGATYNSSLPTNTTGRSVSLQTDINGRLIVTQDSSATALLTNLTKVNGSSLSLGQAAMAASLPVVMASDQSNLPANIKQVNGSTLSLGQTTMSASLPVTIASNQGAISTTVGAPSGTSFARNSPTNIAASGGSATIIVKSALAVSTPTKPLQFVLTASDQVRCALQYNDNSTLTRFTDVTVSPSNPTIVWSPPAPIGLTTSSTSTTQQYEAVCTNFGGTAQDVYVSLVYCSSASGC